VSPTANPIALAPIPIMNKVYLTMPEPESSNSFSNSSVIPSRVEEKEV
jgi:hypothetical protein